MKYRHVALLFIIAGLFLIVIHNKVIAATAGTTVTLRVPNLPRGG